MLQRQGGFVSAKMHRTAFNESNATSENGTSIERISRRRFWIDIFL
jgi:hypothetical protein